MRRNVAAAQNVQPSSSSVTFGDSFPSRGSLFRRSHRSAPLPLQTTHTCPAAKPRPWQTLQGWGVQAVRQRAHRAAASAAAVGISRNELINQMIAFALDNMDDSAEE